MTKLPNKPPKVNASRKGRKGNFPPPGPINIVRFSRSLWPNADQDGELCDAIIEAALETIGKVADHELRREKLRTMLDLTYEELKEP